MFFRSLGQMAGSAGVFTLLCGMVEYPGCRRVAGIARGEIGCRGMVAWPFGKMTLQAPVRLVARMTGSSQPCGIGSVTDLASRCR